MKFNLHTDLCGKYRSCYSSFEKRTCPLWVYEVSDDKGNIGQKNITSGCYLRINNIIYPHLTVTEFKKITETNIHERIPDQNIVKNVIEKIINIRLCGK